MPLSIGDGREGNRKPDGAPPLWIELACILGAIFAGAVLVIVQSWLR